MKLTDEIKQAVADAAAEWHFPASLLTGFVLTESSGVRTATRFEPGFLRRYVLKIPGLNTEERRGRSTSWGLMQVMGEVARGYGFKDSFDKLLIPQIGLHYGCTHLRNLHNRYFKRYGLSGVIAAYNAGSPRFTKDGRYVNQTYVDRVLKFAKESA